MPNTLTSSNSKFTIKFQVQTKQLVYKVFIMLSQFNFKTEPLIMLVVLALVVFLLLAKKQFYLLLLMLLLTYFFRFRPIIICFLTKIFQFIKKYLPEEILHQTLYIIWLISTNQRCLLFYVPLLLGNATKIIIGMASQKKLTKDCFGDLSILLTLTEMLILCQEMATLIIGQLESSKKSIFYLFLFALKCGFCLETTQSLAKINNKYLKPVQNHFLQQKVYQKLKKMVGFWKHPQTENSTAL